MMVLVEVGLMSSRITPLNVYAQGDNEPSSFDKVVCMDGEWYAMSCNGAVRLFTDFLLKKIHKWF